jgi:hypothetical protein
MKKSLIVFFVTFGLSIALTFLPLAASTIVPQGSIAESISTRSVLNLFLSLIGLSLFFTIFYILANNYKIIASKSTIIALLLGVILGSATVYLPNIFLYPSYYGLYLGMFTNSSMAAVLGFYFPALTALLFVELKEKRSSDNLTA